MGGLNRRVHPRSLTDQRAEIVLDEGRIRCVVRDRSAGGARLVFRHVTRLPGVFDLLDGTTTRRVELVWFDGLQAGVRFSSADV